MSKSRSLFNLRYITGVNGSPFALLEDENGPLSVTNDAENVVKAVLENWSGPTGRILYRDSDGTWDELVHDGVEFVRFSSFQDPEAAAAIRADK